MSKRTVSREKALYLADDLEQGHYSMREAVSVIRLLAEDKGAKEAKIAKLKKALRKIRDFPLLDENDLFNAGFNNAVGVLGEIAINALEEIND